MLHLILLKIRSSCVQLKIYIQSTFSVFFLFKLEFAYIITNLLNVGDHFNRNHRHLAVQHRKNTWAFYRDSMEISKLEVNSWIMIIRITVFLKHTTSIFGISSYHHKMSTLHYMNIKIKDKYAKRSWPSLNVSFEFWNWMTSFEIPLSML